MTRAMLGIYRNADKPVSKPDVLLERTGDGYPEGTLPGLVPALQGLRDMLSFESFHCLTMEIEETSYFHRQDELCWIVNMSYFYRINCDEQELVVYRSRYDWDKDRFKRTRIATIDLSKPFDVKNPHLDKIGYYWIPFQDGSIHWCETLKEAKDYARGGIYMSRNRVFKLNDDLKPVMAY